MTIVVEFGLYMIYSIFIIKFIMKRGWPQNIYLIISKEFS